jgi:uncharacterized Zn-finger protein
VNVVEILRIFVKFVERNTRGRNIWPTITGRTQKKHHSNVKFVASRLPAKSILRHIFYGIQVRTFKSDYLRRIHIAIFFAGETNHKCDICAKTFTRKEHLSNHVRQHTGREYF